MNDLLELTIRAHGGLDQWKKFEKITARIICGGITWGIKQQPNILDDVYVTADTNREFTSHYPFIQKNWHTVFEPNRVAIEDDNNQVIEELLNPRASFDGHTTETPWSRLQLAYFAGYAMWTYFNVPFIFINQGFQSREIEPWTENGQQYRRLEVTFPKEIATHGSVQTFYIDSSGLIKRHDYNVDVLGGSGAVHYLSDYIEVQGIQIPTQRMVYVRLEDNTPLYPEPLLVSVALNEITLK